MSTPERAPGPSPEVTAEGPPPPDPQGVGRPFTRAELEVALGRIKDKAPGMDNVTGPMLRNLPDEGKDFLLAFFNWVWAGGAFPKAWKHSLLMPLLKPSKPSGVAGSYRPVALASIVYKLYERLIMPRLE